MTGLNEDNKEIILQPQEKVDTNLQKKVDASEQVNIEQGAQLASQETSEDPNWRAFREARKKDREERQAAEKRAAEKEAEATALKAAMEAAFSKSASSFSPQQESYDQPEETEDERIEKKVQAAIAAREAAAERARIEREQREYPQRLVQSYPDFNQTISQDNLDYLDYHFPEISRPLQRLQEGFDKWSDIYAAIKRFVPNSTTAKKEAAKAEANFNKPKSMSSAAVNPTGEGRSNEPMHSIEARRAARYAEMKRIINGV